VDRSTKCRDKPSAIRVEARWINEITEAGDTLAPLKMAKDRKPVFLSQLALRVWPVLEHRVKPSTLSLYQTNMRPLVCSNLGNCYVHNISSEMITDFAQERLQEVGVSCTNNSLRMLRIALNLAEEWKLILRAPKIRLLTGEHSRDFVISEELLTQMLEHELCTDLLRKLLPFLLDTGLRISEALALKWEHVGLKPKPGASLGWVRVTEGKTKFARRYVPLTQRALACLIKNDSEFVFPAANGRQLSRHRPAEQFRAIRDEMRLPKDCCIHSFRHSFCTRLGIAGVDSFTLRQLAGHSSVVISQRYVHPTGAQAEAAIGKLGS
jgi:integrase